MCVVGTQEIYFKLGWCSWYFRIIFLLCLTFFRISSCKIYPESAAVEDVSSTYHITLVIIHDTRLQNSIISPILYSTLSPFPCKSLKLKSFPQSAGYLLNNCAHTCLIERLENLNLNNSHLKYLLLPGLFSAAPVTGIVWFF